MALLSPALRAQPPDRDVRIVLGSCSTYMNGEMPSTVPVPNLEAAATMTAKGKMNAKKPDRNPPKAVNPSKAYGSAKLALLSFSHAFQRHLESYKRPDKAPSVARVLCVDPGWSRTPGMRRALSNGSLWGLLGYLVTWPIWWLLLKSPEQGAESFLYALMEERFARGGGWHYIKECREVGLGAKETEVKGDEVQKQLWEMSDKAIEALEKTAAQKRALQKREEEERKKEEEKRAQREKDAERKTGSRKSKKLER